MCLEYSLIFRVQVVYSFALNRRHSAYAFASSAVRLGTIMGMHLNIPDHQFRDREVREHRTRLWWSAYIFDRTCVAKLGHPTSVHDDDIQVDLPSGEGLESEDFADADYILQSIELTRLSAQIINSIYSRQKHQTAFSHRVQSNLKQLTKWVESLPQHLRLHNVGAAQVSPNHIVYLHLTFNQVRTYG
jgi:proline utilization trans-activator